MTRDEAIKMILMRCGRRENDLFLQTVAVAEMQLAQETKLEGADFIPWFLLSENMTAYCGAGERRLPLPPGFLEEHEEGSLWVRPAIGNGPYDKLEHGDVDTLEYRYEGVLEIPREYAVAKNNFLLFPTPNDRYQLKMRCYVREPVLNYAYGSEAQQTVRTNAWLTQAADWLIGETGKVIAGQYTRDQEAAAFFEKMAMEARVRIYAKHVAREEMNRERSAGDD